MFDGLKLTDRGDWTERDPDEYLRYNGHIRDDVVEAEDGALIATGELIGRPFHLEAHGARNAEFWRHVTALRNIGLDNVVLYEHLVRHERITPVPEGEHRAPFARDFEAAYQRRVLGDLYANTWLVSVVVRPRNAIERQARGLWSRARRTRPEANPDRRGGSRAAKLRQLDSAMSVLGRALRANGLRWLGVEERDGFQYSQIAEAWRLILYGRWEPVGLTEDGGFNASIYTDRIVCGAKGFHVQRPGREGFGIVHGFRQYPKRCRIGMFNPLLGVRGRLVLTNSFAFQSNTAAEDFLSLRARQMGNIGDAAQSAAAELEDARDDVASGHYVMGDHHWSLAVHADTLPAAQLLSDEVRGALSGVQMNLAAEGRLGGEAAVFAQLPNNRRERTRPGVIASTNFCRMSSLNDYPRGRPEDQWGRAVLRLATTALTPYDHRQAVRDVRHLGLFGPNGSGKSTFLGVSVAMLDGTVGGRGGCQVLFDKDAANELLILAMGGRYVTLRRGDSGMAPLKRLPDTAHTRSWLLEWLTGLIMADGRGGPTPEETEGLARGIAFVMRLPRHRRGIAAVREFLGSHPEGLGAGERLEQWCRGGARGWAFDGDEDRLDFDGGLAGVNPTELLEDEAVCPPMAAYMLLLVGLRMEHGARGALWADEFKAYLADARFMRGFEDFVLRMRKRNWFLGYATQQPEHLLLHPMGRSILGQTKQFALFANEAANLDAYCGNEDGDGPMGNGLGCTPGEYRVVKQEMAAEGWSVLIKRESGGEGMAEGGQAASSSVLCRFDLSPLPEYVAILSGRTKTVALARRIRAEVGEDPAAWLPVFWSRLHEARA
jgi:type IV secretion system protein VirB4